ncbi:MAG TPA: ComF family protein [Burkholderiales bacterium]|nr:ComF family protein [Burkholderiales bacterium]
MNLRDLLNGLLAQDCVLCAAAGSADLICSACKEDLPWLEAGCPRCANRGPAGDACGACIAQPPQYNATTALWAYDFPLDRLVLALKYNERLAFAAYFGEALAQKLRGRAVDLVIPMPLHPRRLRSRGFNQSVEITRACAKALRLTWRTDVLERIRDTAPQAELPLDERARNVRGAFLYVGDLSGKSVAVVDDVMTTGATLNEAAAALKRAGAIHVENWVVARA